MRSTTVQLLVACLAMAAGHNSTALRGAEDAARRLVKDAPFHMAWAHSANFCLSSDGNRIENGVKVQLWECDQSFKSVGQNFVTDEQNRIRMHANREYCVVIDNDKITDGSKIQLWKCDEKNENQQWYTTLMGQVNSKKQPSFCMVISSNRAFNGAKIQLWSCDGDAELKEWMKVVLGPNGRAVAVPNADGACQAPFEASGSKDACLAAAEALRPGQGCMWGKWNEVIKEANEPTWPKGCYFYAACQGGCGLYFNPTGEGQNCPRQGGCMSISMICQLAQ